MSSYSKVTEDSQGLMHVKSLVVQNPLVDGVCQLQYHPLHLTQIMRSSSDSSRVASWRDVDERTESAPKISTETPRLTRTRSYGIFKSRRFVFRLKINKSVNEMEKVVDLARQINLEVESDDVQELLDSHYQELTMHEQGIEEHESLDPIQSEDRVNINVALFSYTRAFGDGPRHLEPWSSDVDDT
ncbi:hypothetical protein TNCV_4631631 [Trichonephila clavipes]|nr:hypothetical protein TNCV_4631631 [Trichonephila clavipes]